MSIYAIEAAKQLWKMPENLSTAQKCAYRILSAAPCAFYSIAEAFEMNCSEKSINALQGKIVRAADMVVKLCQKIAAFAKSLFVIGSGSFVKAAATILGIHYGLGLIFPFCRCFGISFYASIWSFRPYYCY